MGTTYSIKYQPGKRPITQKSVDSILVALNQSLSTYIPSSTISKINASDNDARKITVLDNGVEKSQLLLNLVMDPHFIANYKMASEIYYKTGGAFDPTVMPLVNYWGFGTTEKIAVSQIDSQKIKVLKSYVGLEKVNFEIVDSFMTIIKPPNLSLDFSAIAKGYGVDYLARYFKSQDMHNFMIEIGGEVYCSGLSPSNKKWVIGINKPKVGVSLTEFSELVSLENIGLASSGNYRIFHEIDGQLYGHEINPKTGYPEMNDLLSVSVLAPTTMEADAVATGLMIMGLESAKAFVEKYQHLEAIFFSSNNSGKIVKEYSSGIGQFRQEEVLDTSNIQ